MTAHHVIRRAVDTIAAVADSKPADIPPLASVIFFLTLTAFFVVFIAIGYTYGNLIPTLCMIESPETSAYVPVNQMAREDEPPAYTEGEEVPVGDETNLVRNKPITASIRATVLHLRAQAGYWSRFRGLGLFLVLDIFRNILLGFASIGTKRPFVLAIAAVIADVLLANIHMTWIHVVISEPSPKRWWRRLPSPAFQSWKRIAPAVAISSVAMQLTYLLPMLVVGAGAIKYADPSFEPGRKEMYLTMGQMLGAVVLMIVLFISLQIPAMVMMTRVAASMLPEEDETIVPFDRTYGGKVTPAIIGGEGKVGLLEAWRSFPWTSRKRLLLLCAKVSGIVMALYLFFSALVALEAHFLFGPEAFGELMKILRGASHRQS